MSPRTRDFVLLAALTCAIGLPFLNKPFHIDDSYMLVVCQNVLDNPLNPFAGFLAWFGQPDPLWKMVTNPPLLSYYLAPFAALSDFDEIALHLAMLPFLLILAAALLSLGRRFTARPWFTVLFVMTSVGVVVSSNVMSDIPTVALSTAAVSLCIAGTDRSRAALLLLSSLAAGLAILTKYSAASVLPLLVLYPLLKNRPRAALFSLLAVAMVAAWSAHNVWIYGETHIGRLLTRDWGELASWRDNLSGLPVVAGSLIFLLPALLVSGLKSGDLPARLAPFFMMGVWFATQSYLEGAADAQYLFWSLTGSGLILICLAESARGSLVLAKHLCDPKAGDSLFLAAWLAGTLLFSVSFVPFQAVRHLLPALPPLVLLGMRALERNRGEVGAPSETALNRGLAALVALQLAVAFVVAASDYEQAATYRDFAVQAAERQRGEPGSTWYIGHWGWFFYGERAGFKPLSPSGPYPVLGDVFVQPVNYYNGSVPNGNGKPGQPPRMFKAGEQHYEPSIRLRAMHPAGAGFYAMYSKRGEYLPSIPYRWLPAHPLETFVTYKVGR